MPKRELPEPKSRFWWQWRNSYYGRRGPYSLRESLGYSRRYGKNKWKRIQNYAPPGYFRRRPLGGLAYRVARELSHRSVMSRARRRWKKALRFSRLKARKIISERSKFRTF